MKRNVKRQKHWNSTTKLKRDKRNKKKNNTTKKNGKKRKEMAKEKEWQIRMSRNHLIQI